MDIHKKNKNFDRYKKNRYWEMIVNVRLLIFINSCIIIVLIYNICKINKLILISNKIRNI